MDRVTALCCLKLGSQAPGKCHTFVCCFSVREDDFCMTLEGRYQAATLCQLMVMLHGRLVTGCPYTMGPTLGAKFVVAGFISPFGGDGSCAGPMVGVDKCL